MINEYSVGEKGQNTTKPHLPKEVFEIWRKSDRALSPVAIVATTDADGTPRTAPFGSLHAINPHMLRLCCHHQHATYANLCRDGRVSVSLLSPNHAVSLRGRARIVKPQMSYDPERAIFEIDIEEVKDDLGPRLTIDSGITAHALEQHRHWFDNILKERDEA